ENLFKRREFVFVDAVKEFYARMTVTHLKKKDVVKSSVKGVDVWEESKYTKPLEITRRFANDETLTAARRVKSGELNPFQRFIHFLVMKNVVPRFGKRDTSSFMDLTYMDHLMSRRLVNLPRVMIRHMSYVISMKDHELPYGDWLTMVFEEFGDPLETFPTMCKLTRENGVWWIGSGENRRRDDDNVPEEEAQEEERNQAEFDWEAGGSESDDQFFDAQVDVEEPVTETPAAPEVVAQDSVQQKEIKASGVDPSGGPSGHLPEAVMNKLQAEFERARANRFQADLEKAQAENATLLALLQQAQSKQKP
ncbi:hypothetical protein Dimus_018015, partial [Dionaea muscipula]